MSGTDVEDAMTRDVVACRPDDSSDVARHVAGRHPERVDDEIREVLETLVEVAQRRG